MERETVTSLGNSNVYFYMLQEYVYFLRNKFRINLQASDIQSIYTLNYACFGRTY